MEKPGQKKELESGRIRLLDTWVSLAVFVSSRRGKCAVMLLDGPCTHPDLLTTFYIHLVQWQIRINKRKHRWTITVPLGVCPCRSSPPDSAHSNLASAFVLDSHQLPNLWDTGLDVSEQEKISLPVTPGDYPGSGCMFLRILQHALDTSKPKKAPFIPTKGARPLFPS